MTHLTHHLDVPRPLTLPGLAPFRKLRTWLRYRRNLREIATLDERTLHDIGASRCELMGHAWRNACGEPCGR